MSIGDRHRLTGLLLDSRRGPVLHIDDGGVWALDIDRKARKYLGTRVIVDGIRSGFDRLSVDWVGPDSSNDV